MNDNEIENIRKNANIVDVIRSYLPLTEKGKNYFGVCPFHEDHSPSMSVSEEKQIYKCFSCGAAGNVFTFVRDYENVSFLEAVKIVAEKCGLTFKGIITPQKKKTHVLEYEIMNLALKYYQNNLNTEYGVVAKEYLKKRGIDEQIIKEFDLGLALDINHPLHPLLTSKKYSIDMISSLGLINQKDNMVYDTFQNRILFPIHNLEGDVVGFTGRIYDDSKQAKYLNSKETVIFKKGSILFNYHRARDEIKRKKEIIIVEGNMDAIRLFSVGIKNVVALMGTSLTKEQVDIIKNTRSKVILMFDNDDAGEIATFNNGNILEANGITPFIVRLSGEKDPDEYIIKNGFEAMLNNIENPIYFLDFKLKYLKKNKDLSKTNDLVSYIKEMLDSIKDIQDDLTKELTIKKMSEEYDVPLELLKNELSKIETPKKKIIEKEKTLEKKALLKYDIAAQSILYFMMNDKIYIERFKKELGYFTVRKYRNIANEILYFYEKNKEIELSDFITFMEDKEETYEDMMEIIRNVNIEELSMDVFMDFIKAANEEMVKEQIAELKEKINNEMDASKKLKLAMELVELKKGCVGYEK